MRRLTLIQMMKMMSRTWDMSHHARILLTPKTQSNYPPPGWQAIFVALQSSKCGLEILSPHENYSIGASILSLPSARQNHTTTLKTLNLRSMFLGDDLNMNDDDSCWTAFFQFLQDPNPFLRAMPLK